MAAWSYRCSYGAEACQSWARSSVLTIANNLLLRKYLESARCCLLELIRVLETQAAPARPTVGNFLSPARTSAMKLASSIGPIAPVKFGPVNRGGSPTADLAARLRSDDPLVEIIDRRRCHGGIGNRRARHICGVLAGRYCPVPWCAIDGRLELTPTHQSLIMSDISRNRRL